MSRKDYREIASILTAHANAIPLATFLSLVNAFAMMLAIDNPRFSRERFLDAICAK